MNRKITSILKVDKPALHLFAVVIFLTVSSVSCTSSSDSRPTISSHDSSENIDSVVTQNDTIAAVVQSLIDFSVSDFYKNQQPLPTDFRNVQIKYTTKPNKEIVYILCGQFTTSYKQSGNEWVYFTTIITDPYEQWIGSNALTYCENSKEIPYTKANLSAELINKLRSLLKTEK